MFFLVFAILVVFFSFFLIEIIFRLYGFTRDPLKKNITRISLCCGYKLKPNAEGIYQTDSRGFRITPYDFSHRPASEVYKIVTMGDSITFGSANDTYLAYPSYLEFVLNPLYVDYVLNRDNITHELPKGKIFFDVINAGIIGYSSFQVKQYLKDTILDLNPDMVIISVGATDQGDTLNNPALWFLESKIPFFYWYYNHSATMAYLIKNLSSIISDTKGKGTEIFSKKSLQVSDDNLGNPLAYKAYEDNIRNIVKILKERNILPVLVPWPFTDGQTDIKNFSFEETEAPDEPGKKQYVLLTEKMEKIAREFSVPIIRTPFQEPNIPRKHHVKYFMVSKVHPNNSGARIIGFVIAKAVEEILKGKSSDEVYAQSYASIEDLDLLDLHVEIMHKQGAEKRSPTRDAIYNFELGNADNCVINMKDDLTVKDYHFSSCFFSLSDKAHFLIDNGDYASAKKYLDFSLARYPKFAYPYFIYGLYHLKLGNPSIASDYFKKAVELAPFFKEPKKYLAPQPYLTNPG